MAIRQSQFQNQIVSNLLTHLKSHARGSRLRKTPELILIGNQHRVLEGRTAIIIDQAQSIHHVGERTALLYDSTNGRTDEPKGCIGLEHLPGHGLEDLISLFGIERFGALSETP